MYNVNRKTKMWWRVWRISKYYALQTIVYFIALGINGYMGFKKEVYEWYVY